MLSVARASRILTQRIGSGQAPQHPSLPAGVLSRPAKAEVRGASADRMDLKRSPGSAGTLRGRPIPQGGTVRVAIIPATDGGEPLRLTYQQYLRAPEWANRRLAALKGIRECQACGREARLDAHHRSYERLGHEEPGDLVALCGVCHRGVHQIQKVRRCSVEEATELLLGPAVRSGKASSQDTQMPKMSDGRPPRRRAPAEIASGRRKAYKRLLAREEAETRRLWKGGQR